MSFSADVFSLQWKKKIQSYDARRDLVIPGDKAETIQFCVEHFLSIGNQAIQTRGFFAAALSGGGTPQAIFQALAKTAKHRLEWSKVLLFWSDERSAPPTDPENNYRMALEAGLSELPIPSAQIFRMKGEENIEKNSLDYESLLLEKTAGRLDLTMLGMGDDGHTASLFPYTHGLRAEDRLVIANYVPQKQTWRMSFTYKAIQASLAVAIYVLGKNKAEITKTVLTAPYDPDLFPVQKVGSLENKALWILDQDAASLLLRESP